MGLERKKNYKPEEEVDSQIPSLSSYNEIIPFPDSSNRQYNELSVELERGRLCARQPDVGEDGDENRDLRRSVILYSALRMLADRFVPFREKMGKFFSANREKSSTDTGRYRSTSETAGTLLHCPQ